MSEGPRGAEGRGSPRRAGVFPGRAVGRPRHRRAFVSGAVGLAPGPLPRGMSSGAALASPPPRGPPGGAEGPLQPGAAGTSVAASGSLRGSPEEGGCAEER